MTSPADIGPQESAGRLCTYGRQVESLRGSLGVKRCPSREAPGQEPVVRSLGSALGPLRGSASCLLTQVGAQVRKRAEAEPAQLRDGCCSGVQSEGLPVDLLFFALRAQGPSCCSTDSPAGWSGGHVRLLQGQQKSRVLLNPKPHSTPLPLSGSQHVLRTVIMLQPTGYETSQPCPVLQGAPAFCSGKNPERTHPSVFCTFFTHG